ncbi:uncharacterized protein LOC105254042 isoform X2 [Camponotus floridanus]|uniref:uncharacterized protein LOC105254042 isoform X2 n=1 Tax=Camponotus floridanus TaxID=104421 RepID=UPI00059E8835|nr:uncharacterized protein LOC105254042 isoform X2 [Camponotus floridanus]
MFGSEIVGEKRDISQSDEFQFDSHHRTMEAELLTVDDFFPGLPITIDQGLTEMPQESLINIIANDYGVDTSQPIISSIWNDNEWKADTDAAFSKFFTTGPNYMQLVEFEEFKDVVDMSLCDTKHTWNNMYEGEIANLPQEVNLGPDLKLEEEEQKTVNFTRKDGKKDIFEMMHFPMEIIKTETTKEIKEEKVNDSIILSKLVQETREFERKDANTAKKSRNIKGKRKKRDVIIKDKQEEQEDCIDVETISDEVPVLEAVDVKSLLEQFEASEKNPRNKSVTKNNFLSGTKLNTMQQMTQEYQSQVLKKPSSKVCNQHTNIPDSVSKEVIDRIKASGRKRTISIIPAMPNVQNKNRSSNNTRIQDAGATLAHNKVLKQVTNNAKNKTTDGTLVQLDHDYCYNGFVTRSCDSSKLTKHTSVLKSSQNKEMTKCGKIIECHNNSNSKKDNNLESADICDTNKLAGFTLLNGQTHKINENRLESDQKDCQEKICLEQSCVSNDSLANKPKSAKVSSKSSDKDSPVYLIRSVLAQNILRSRNDLSKNTLPLSAPMQMISVLKKPPNAQSLLKSNSDENIVTTINSLNNEIQNVIVQNTQDLASGEQAKKPPFRKKLNLAEYRNRRDQNRSDNSRTSSPIQPMTLLYVHHASTTTEPIKNDSGDPIWSEREIVSILKPKSDINEEKNKSKPLMCDIEIQTYETVFEFTKRSLVDSAEKNDKRRSSRSRSKSRKLSRSRSRSRSRNRRRRSRSRNRNRSRSESRNRSRSRRSKSRSRSRNRSRSRSRSRNRSQNRNKSMKNDSRSRSRSRSRRCSQRRIRSRRRSSVSSTSSWSSQSRSYTTSTRSRYSRSRSRSSRSRSRSRSFSRDSSCSRSSSYTNYGRSRWSNYRRKGSSDRERSYDRYKRHSFDNRRNYKNWRSPVHSYCKSYNWYNREKQKQVEERRVIYVGRLDENITKADLRRRFEVFGPVADISVHFREHGDNYGFVTFVYKNDAYAAIEHGNDDPSLPTYDLSFGGRRAFCKYKYSDLDDTASSSPISKSSQANEEDTFDFLLEEAKAKLRKRKV